MFLRNNRMFKIKLLFNLINLSNRPQVSVSFASIIELPGAALLEWGPYWKINKNTFEGGCLFGRGWLLDSLLRSSCLCRHAMLLLDH